MTFLKIKGWREALLHRTGAKDIFKIILLFSSRHRHFLSFLKTKCLYLEYQNASNVD